MLSQLLLRAALFGYQFKGINYYGSDSGIYFEAAKGILQAIIWPMGWPWILKFLFIFSDNPYFLLMIQTLFALASQYLFILFLVRFGRMKLLWAAIFSSAIFYSPGWVRFNSLILMADTIVIFLITLTGYFSCKYFFEEEPHSPNWRPFLLTLLMGAMTIFKLVLRVWVLPLLILMLVKNFKQKKFLASFGLIASFLLCPFLYARYYNQHHYGTWDYDLMSGSFLFANAARYSDCTGLAAAFPAPDRLEEFKNQCRDNMVKLHPGLQLYHAGSMYDVTRKKIFPDYDTAKMDHFMRRWSHKIIASHPAVLLKMIQGNLDIYLYGTLGTLSYGSHPSWGYLDHAAPALFGISAEEFAAGWNKKNETDAWVIHKLDRLTLIGLRCVRYLGLAWLAALFVLVLYDATIILSGSTLIALLAFIYSLANFTANFSDARINIISDYLLWLSLGLGLTTAIQTLRLRSQK